MNTARPNYKCNTCGCLFETASGEHRQFCYVCRSDDAQPAKDGVNHPAYYNQGKIEVIEFIEDQGFGEGFCKGNAIKYIARAGKKDPSKEVEDLEKAVWYTRRAIEQIKARNEKRAAVRPNDMPQERQT